MKKLTPHEKYEIIHPILDAEVAATEIARELNLCLATIRYWVKQFKSKGLKGLQRKPRSDRGLYRSISEDLIEITKGLALQKPPLLITAIYRRISIIAKRKDLKAPSYDTVYNIVKSINPGLLTLAIEGSKAYQQKYELLYRRECSSPNEIWQIDHTELDIYILDDKGNDVKPWLTTVIDDYSRAIAGRFLTIEAPSSLNTALALRLAIWKKKNPSWEICGIPNILYTDHGTDFMSLHIQQVCINLKIRIINSTVGRPQGRGKIERFFETLNETVLMDQPGFMKGGQTYSKASLNLKSLDELLEKFIVEKYNHDIHSTTGESPVKRWSHNFLPRLPESIEELDDLLLTITKPRKVQRDGIQFLGFRYIATTLAGFVGELVTIRYDPRDLAEIRVYYHDAYLCRAICQDLAEMTIGLKEIKKARTGIKRELYRKIKWYNHVLKENQQDTSDNKGTNSQPSSKKFPKKNNLKLYEND